MYVCVPIYVCVCVLLYTYVYVYTLLYVCVCVYACMYVCGMVFMYVCVCTHAKQKEPRECKHTGSKDLHQELLLGTVLLEGKLEKTKEKRKSDVRNFFPSFIKNVTNKSRSLSPNTEDASLALKTSSSWIRPCYLSFEGRVSVHLDSGC